MKLLRTYLKSCASIVQAASKMYQGGDTLQACETCPANTLSLQGSTSEADCGCLAGSYNSMNTADYKALTLVPGHAQFSTLANRHLVLDTNMAVFESTGGPGGIGAMTFDTGLSQYMNAGTHTFNVESNGVFTVISVAKLFGVNSYESLVSFGNGPDSDKWNIILERVYTTNTFQFDIRDLRSRCSVHSPSNSLVVDTWHTVIGIYSAEDDQLEVRVDGVSSITTCSDKQQDRTLQFAYVGRSPYDGPYLDGNIAGHNTVDAVLSETDISDIVSRIYTGHDTIQMCETCPVNTFSLQGSMSVANCFDEQDDSLLIAGESQRTCTVCDANAISPAGSTSSTNCSCVAGYTGECTMCCG